MVLVTGSFSSTSTAFSSSTGTLYGVTPDTSISSACTVYPVKFSSIGVTVGCSSSCCASGSVVSGFVGSGCVVSCSSATGSVVSPAASAGSSVSGLSVVTAVSFSVSSAGVAYTGNEIILNVIETERRRLASFFILFFIIFLPLLIILLKSNRNLCNCTDCTNNFSPEYCGQKLFTFLFTANLADLPFHIVTPSGCSKRRRNATLRLA